MTKPRILVVDDKENMLKLFTKILGDGYELTTASDGKQAIALIGEERFDVVVSDLKMPGADGLAVLAAAKQRDAGTEVILMTAFASVENAVAAMKLGAYDYLTKPFDPDDALITIGRAVELRQLKIQTASLRKELQGVYSFHQLIGKSAPMRKVYDLLEKAAGLDITVLITGETGTGKELAARAIHYQSARKDSQFIAVNCGALPADLIESELFGHAKGAFTGAVTAKRGLFEEANGGTIFLDEIGELPLPVQVKLNRVLQEKEIRRVGDNHPSKVDVRIVAATLRDLKDEVKEGRFREDLFYRLHIFPIELPALRDRREDIPLLAQHFLAKHGNAHHRKVESFSPEALRILTGGTWHGNVRELENAVERAVAVSSSSIIEARDLPDDVRDDKFAAPSDDTLLGLTYKDAVERGRTDTSILYLGAIMRSFGGNVTRAAEQAGIERESLHRLLKRYGIKAEDYK